MFRIRRILESTAPANKQIISQVQEIFFDQFKSIVKEEILELPNKLNDPVKFRFQTRLFVAQKGNGDVLGFALLLHVPDIEFCYLDYLATRKGQMGRGLGSVLYEKVRQEAKNLKSRVLFLECLPDDPKLSPKEEIRKENIKRLAFYERYGAYPVEGTLYELPVKKDAIDPPYLVMDMLGNEFPDLKFIKKAVRAILERNYEKICTKEYIDKVVDSFTEDTVKLRAPKYKKKAELEHVNVENQQKIIYVANEVHDIHHVKDRGYVESPVRVKVILRELAKLPFMEQKNPETYPDRFLTSVHDSDYVDYLKKACNSIPEGKSVYPYVFPIRNKSRQPKEMADRAGYYCIDTFTPLNKRAYIAARAGVNCVLTATDLILEDQKIAYALVRPPGHHAERKAFGGFCYFANSAIAAQHLSQFGKVAILDIDYHHGNSQQNIFYARNDVLTISLHGHPKFAYPYFTGFEDETGEGEGEGFNINMPLPETITVDDYLRKLTKALKLIKDFSPQYLVVAFGLDTAKADPTGTWPLRANDFSTLGSMIGVMHLPTLIVQEGGYRTRTLGVNARHFFVGLQNSSFEKSVS